MHDDRDGIDRNARTEAPDVFVPMGGVSGGHLAATVSNAGGLGLVGGGYADPAWLRTELSRVKEETRRPWGVGLITWSITRSVFDLALSYRPDAFMLSFGDPAALCGGDQGGRLQTDLPSAGPGGSAAGAGSGGGHRRGPSHRRRRARGWPRHTAVGAGGGRCGGTDPGGGSRRHADGRGLAAALVLGAHGGLIGTRFYASPEALGQDRAKQRIVAACGNETARTSVFDIVRGYAWPPLYTGRALRNRFMERWDGRESELAVALEMERVAYQGAAREGDCDTAVVFAGEAVDLIKSVESAATLVARISAEAEAQLQIGAGLAQ